MKIEEKVLNYLEINKTSYQVEVNYTLKKRIQNNPTWEDAFYQSEWVKINSSWVIFIISL